LPIRFSFDILTKEREVKMRYMVTICTKCSSGHRLSEPCALAKTRKDTFRHKVQFHVCAAEDCPGPFEHEHALQRAEQNRKRVMRMVKFAPSVEDLRI